MGLLLLDSAEPSAATAVVVADATNDIGAAAQVSVSVAIAVSVAASIADELSAAASVSVTSSVPFVPPAPGDPRVAVVTH